MYVTPPDTDVYVVPKVLAPSNASKEPPIDAPRDPLYKSEKEVLKDGNVDKRYKNVQTIHLSFAGFLDEALQKSKAVGP
ncbi:hypothetical protein CSA_021613 [Cucumis sativus]|uniref:Uncharacterized protein n=2 Tax=Cucumis sativus TaxID=3659 RepID=A0ACB6HBZ1_CUCSA|nr:hypothetical protein CSA_021601 [Cucumis sativus]KAE8637427.1 hypothetical protein CSA_021613 [Cucumis sativus]